MELKDLVTHERRRLNLFRYPTHGIETYSGKPPQKTCHFYLGIAQIAIAPPPALNRALWGTLFSDQFEQLCQITVLMVISAPNHPGKHFDPPTMKQMPI